LVRVGATRDPVYNGALRTTRNCRKFPMELAPITQRLDDLQQRVEALRGYL